MLEENKHTPSPEAQLPDVMSAEAFGNTIHDVYRDGYGNLELTINAVKQRDAALLASKAPQNDVDFDFDREEVATAIRSVEMTICSNDAMLDWQQKSAKLLVDIARAFLSSQTQNNEYTFKSVGYCTNCGSYEKEGAERHICQTQQKSE